MTHIKGREVDLSFSIQVTAARCLIALLWLLGRRIGEVLVMNKDDVELPYTYEEEVFNDHKTVS